MHWMALIPGYLVKMISRAVLHMFRVGKQSYATHLQLAEHLSAEKVQNYYGKSPRVGLGGRPLPQENQLSDGALRVGLR